MKTKMLAVACLFFVAMVLHLVPAQAGDGWEKYIEWYSDASKTEVVGWRYQYCGGTSDSEGYQTSYREQWFIAECVEGGGGWVGTVCNYNPQYPFVCPAYCAYCV